MLVTLLVLWVVVVPLVTVIGTYVLSGLLRRRPAPGAPETSRIDVLIRRRVARRPRGLVHH